jgi:hypothetical protein
MAPIEALRATQCNWKYVASEMVEGETERNMSDEDGKGIFKDSWKQSAEF